MNQIDKILNTDLEQIKIWVNENLIRASEAIEITGQSKSAFTQSVREGYLTPFYSNGSNGGFGTINLYLKSDVEDYAIRIKERRKKLNMK